MQPAIDYRSSLGNQPGFHALIVGVSAYPNLPRSTDPLAPHHYGMRQLSSAALAAYRIYAWLVDRQQFLTVPLATIRLLLTPSPEELAAQPDLKGLALGSTLDNLMQAAGEWREDACSHQENVTFFYFAGHGAQRKRGDHVLLLEGFGDGIGGALRNAVTTSDIEEGMAPTKKRKEIARTQVYIFDACRFTPGTFQDYEELKTGAIWDVDKVDKEIDDRVAPVFYTTVPGSKAYGLPGEETVFSRALLNCLNGGAGVALDEDNQEWSITTNSLNNALEYHLNKVNEVAGANQMFRSHGLGPRVVLHRLDGPPSVDVTLQVDPEAAAAYTQVKMLDDYDQPVREISAPFHPHPFHDRLPAGTYRIDVNIVPPTSPYKNMKKSLSIAPPCINRTLRVSP